MIGGNQENTSCNNQRRKEGKPSKAGGTRKGKMKEKVTINYPNKFDGDGRINLFLEEKARVHMTVCNHGGI